MTEIRDKLISKSIRMCWNPDCGYAMAISKTECVKCCWTKNGPPHELTSPLENPVGPSFIGVVKAKGKTVKPIATTNKTEDKYAAYLEAKLKAGDILFYEVHPSKWNLADGTGYTPDFMVMDLSGGITFLDTKAYYKNKGKPGIKESSMVKMKMMASKYWMFTMKATWFHDGQWQERTF